MREGGINRLPMDNRKRAFTKVIKIRPNQKEYIKLIKGRYSEAGKLDEIINFYRNAHDIKLLIKNADEKRRNNKT